MDLRAGGWVQSQIANDFINQAYVMKPWFKKTKQNTEWGSGELPD